MGDGTARSNHQSLIGYKNNFYPIRSRHGVDKNAGKLAVAGRKGRKEVQKSEKGEKFYCRTLTRATRNIFKFLVLFTNSLETTKRGGRKNAKIPWDRLSCGCKFFLFSLIFDCFFNFQTMDFKTCKFLKVHKKLESENLFKALQQKRNLRSQMLLTIPSHLGYVEVYSHNGKVGKNIGSIPWERGKSY